MEAFTHLKPKNAFLGEFREKAVFFDSHANIGRLINII
jgi:hypothetical protein